MSRCAIGSSVISARERVRLDALPVLITLDHNTLSAPTQRVDYVYVRPAAASEPTAGVQTSSLACGSAP